MSARMGQDVLSTTLLWERWIRIEGQWYYLQDRAASPSPKVAPGH
jgi:hypothetical protein